jgi:hypothetical protein
MAQIEIDEAIEYYNLFMFLQNSSLADIGLKITRDKKFLTDAEI